MDLHFASIVNPTFKSAAHLMQIAFYAHRATYMR